MTGVGQICVRAVGSSGGGVSFSDCGVVAGYGRQRRVCVASDNRICEAVSYLRAAASDLVAELDLCRVDAMILDGARISYIGMSDNVYYCCQSC